MNSERCLPKAEVTVQFSRARHPGDLAGRDPLHAHRRVRGLTSHVLLSAAAILRPLRTSSTLSVALAAALAVLATPARGTVCTYTVNRFPSPGTITVFDMAAQTTTSSIVVGRQVLNMTVSPDGSRLYAATFDRTDGGSVVLVDTDTNTVRDTFLTGRLPVDVALNADGSRLYVLTGYGWDDSGSVLVVDPASATVLSRIPIGGADFNNSIAVTPRGTYAYVVKPVPKVVSVIDLQSGKHIRDIGFSERPKSVAVSADGARAYVTTARLTTIGLYGAPSAVIVIDTATHNVTGMLPSVRDLPPGIPLNTSGRVVSAALPQGCYGSAGSPTPTWTPTPTYTPRPVPTATPTFTPVPTAARVPTRSPIPRPTALTTWEYIYVANSASDSVSVIDAATDAAIATIAVGAGPTDIAARADGSTVYVLNRNSGSVSVIDTATNTVAGTLEVGYGPWSIALAPDDSVAYVTNRWAGTVSVIDTATRTLAATIDLPGRWNSSPTAIVVTPNGVTVFVAGNDPELSGRGALFAIDAARNIVVATTVLDGPPLAAMAMSSDGRFIYAIQSGYPTASLSVIDAATGTVSGEIGLTDAADIALSPSGGTAYVTTMTGVNVLDIGSGSFTVAVPTGLSPTRVAVSADGTRAYVTNARSYTVAVIDTATNSVTATIPVLATPQGLAIARAPRPFFTPTPTPPAVPAEIQTCAYVANQSNGLSVINTATNRIVATVAVGTTVGNVALTPDGAFAYVIGLYRNDLSVIDTSNKAVVAVIPLDARPNDIAITPDGRLVYVVTGYMGTVAVIDTVTKQVVAHVPAGRYASKIAVAPDGAVVYVGMWDCTERSCESRVLAIATATNAVIGSTVIRDGSTIQALGVSPDGAELYVGSAYCDTLQVIDTTSHLITATIQLRGFPSSIAFTADGTRAYVTADGLQIVDTLTRTVTDTIAAFGSAVALSPNGAYAYVTGGPATAVIDTHTQQVVDDVPTGAAPTRRGPRSAALAIAAVVNGCRDPEALTPRPTRTPSPTVTPTFTPSRTPTHTPVPRPTATRTPSFTRTATATRTATPIPSPVLLVASSTSGVPGEVVSVGVWLRARGRQPVGVQNDLRFDPSVRIAARPNGRPACTVNPTIDKRATSFLFQPPHCTVGVNCEGVRALVFAFDNFGAIPDRSLLYTCSVTISAAASVGSHPLRITRPSASGKNGEDLVALGLDGQVVVWHPDRTRGRRAADSLPGKPASSAIEP